MITTNDLERVWSLLVELNSGDCATALPSRLPFTLLIEILLPRRDSLRVGRSNKEAKLANVITGTVSINMMAKTNRLLTRKGQRTIATVTVKPTALIMAQRYPRQHRGVQNR